jgi:hypothetical protein
MHSTADVPTVNHHTDSTTHPPQLPHPSASSPGHHSQTPAYTPKVSFDTFENPAASMFSFTLRVMSEGYKRTRNTRVFLCAASPDESGSQALEWCLESLVQDGDELIVFRGVDEEGLGKSTPDTQSSMLTKAFHRKRPRYPTRRRSRSHAHNSR